MIKSSGQLNNRFFIKRFSKRNGGNMVSGMLPFLLTILFIFMIIFIIMDYYSSVQIRHTVEDDLQKFVDNASLDGRISDDMQEEITDYLKDTYNVDPDTVDFTGSSDTGIKNGGYVNLVVKCVIPLESRYFFNEYNTTLRVKCRSTWTGA